MSEPVKFTLSKDEALVLFEFLSRVSDDGDWSVEDSAEIRVLWKLQGLLQKILVEPFEADYGKKIDVARDAGRDPEGTNASAERSAGRLGLWLDPKDIAFIADEWRRISGVESAEAREKWSRVAFRAMAALNKAGIDYEPQVPSGGEGEPGAA